MESNASFWEAVRGAAASLHSSKLRSFLTLLGIILATTTLIAVMAVINGMNHYIAENVSDMGADGFRVRRMVMIGDFDPKKYLEMQRRNPELTREEFDFLKTHATMLQEIGMETERQVKVHYANEQIDGVELDGVSSNMASLANTQISEGRFLSETENQRRQTVAFVGNDIKLRFFPSTNPLGKTLFIEGRPFDIVGVAKAKGSVFGNSEDNFVQIPIETYFKMYGARKDLGYRARAFDPSYLFRAQDEVRMLLRSFRHLLPGQDDTFAIFSSDSLVSAWNGITGSCASGTCAAGTP